MENYINYMGIYSTSGDVKTALDNGDLNKPYVALVNGNVDFNTLEGEIDYSNIPLTFEITSDGTININYNSVDYKKNDGEWTTASADSTISVVSGDTVQFRKNSELMNSYDSLFTNTNCEFNVYGNIMSLYYATGFENITVLSNLDYKESFYNLFYSCTGLTDASNLILPATTLTEGCYESMFADCPSLTTAPELPATVLTDSCYSTMFAGCSSLTTGPELPATTLASNCYSSMFQGCSNLNYIKCLATEMTASNCTVGWVDGVSETGTFVKAEDAFWDTGYDGIPDGWTIIDAS